MARDYRQAFRDARRLIVPPQVGGDRWSDAEIGFDAYRLAQAQWIYDYVSKEKGLALLRDLNMMRKSRDWDAHCEGIPDGDPRRYPALDLNRGKAR